MRILHTIRSLIVNSGVTTFVTEVAAAQAAVGHDVTVWCFSMPDTVVLGAKVLVTKDLPRESEFDVVHIHAFWSFYQLRVLRWCRKHRVPYIVSPHGGLMPRVFTKGRLKKFIFWHFLLKPVIKQAVAIHGTSNAEIEACKALGLKGQFAVAPLGVHLPELNSNIINSRHSNIRTILFLGRLGEEKGLVNLLTAWHRLRSQSTYYNNWILKLAGPDWRGYKNVLDDKIAAEHITGVVFTGSADAALKEQLYRSADIFVLPSPMENFSMVVLDALAYGVPVIATKGTPWSELESEHSGLWIEQGLDALIAALIRLMSLSDTERSELGVNGRSLAATKYQWPLITEILLDVYRSVCK